MKQKEDTFVGKNEISWNLDEHGILTMEGQGKIPDCDCGCNASAPWKNVLNQIRELHIMEGVTEIGMKAFMDCENLEKVVLPHSLRRIHAYAFWDCKRLACIESDRNDFQYVYDDRNDQKENLLIFGVESFHNVPWSRSRWGDFYIRYDRLYVTFAGGSQNLIVPEGVRVIKSFSTNHLNVDSVKLPKTLEVIENFAFSDSTVKEEMILPDSVSDLDPYAFADCSVLLKDSPILKKMIRTGWGLPKEERNRVPGYFKQYSVSLLARKRFGKFRKIIVTENKPKQNGTLPSLVLDSSIDVGRSIYRRIRGGKVILCVSYKDNRVLSVKSFAWHRVYEIPNEYLMYPVLDEEDGVLPWRDSFTYQEKEDIVQAFEISDGAFLKNIGMLRVQDPDTYEEWFWSDDRENFGGPLEISFLHMWLSLHPEITVDSKKENIENDRYRWFVDV